MRSAIVTLLCGCAVAALLAAASSARAETYVGGVICTDTTWNLAGSPYTVTVAAGGSIVVGCGATLTVEPGVEVRFEPLRALLVGWSAWGPRDRAVADPFHVRPASPRAGRLVPDRLPRPGRRRHV